MKMQSLSERLKSIGSDLFIVWIMATIGVCFGLAINQFRDTPLPLAYSPKTERMQEAVTKISREIAIPKFEGAANDAFKADAAAVRYVDLSTFREIVEKKARGIILDARPEIFHRLGHVPGAISLPREEFETSYNKQRFLLEKDKSQPIAVYCSSSSCEDSQMVADALIELAYTHVFVFKGGWNDWTGAHLPEEKAQ